MSYIKRLIDEKIELYREIIGAIVIAGPKWCGKSTTLKNYAKTIVPLQDPYTHNLYSHYASMGREHILAGERPILFDEWQKLPEVWDYIRAEIDDQQLQEANFYLTGSYKPEEDETRHPGSGRFAKLTMKTLSLFESKESNGSVSLRRVFDDNFVKRVESNITPKELANIVCRGGWPALINKEMQVLSSFNTKTQTSEIDQGKSLNSIKNLPIRARLLIEQYLLHVLESDFNDIDGTKRDPIKGRKILQSFSRHIGGIVPLSKIFNDINTHEKIMSDETFYSYVKKFEELYIIENIKAWSPKLRSSTAINGLAKIQLVDPSIAAYLLDANPNDLLRDLETYGFLFESLCLRDLSIYASYINATLSYFKDKSGLEVDAVIHLSDGRWGAIEIKLGGKDFDKAANNLLKLKDKVLAKEKPSFLMIITGIEKGYTRDDGVLVVPISTLCP